MRCTGANLSYPSTLPAQCPIAPTIHRSTEHRRSHRHASPHGCSLASVLPPKPMHRRMVVRSLRYSHRSSSTRSGVAPTAPTGCGGARCGHSYSGAPTRTRPIPKCIKSEGSPTMAIRETGAHKQLQIRPAGFTTVMTPSAPCTEGSQSHGHTACVARGRLAAPPQTVFT